MKLLEITEDTDDDVTSFMDAETQRERIRKIIEHQKSLHLSSSTSSSSSSSSSFQPLASRRSSLFNLMRSGSTSLRRLFAMEHTGLATLFRDYSGSPVTKPISLWDSDEDTSFQDPWAFIAEIRGRNQSSSKDHEEFGSESENRKATRGKRKLRRKKSSFARLPRFGLWICGGFIFRLRLRRKLRIFSFMEK